MPSTKFSMNIYLLIPKQYFYVVEHRVITFHMKFTEALFDKCKDIILRKNIIHFYDRCIPFFRSKT